jgi:hypothetical protein
MNWLTPLLGIIAVVANATSDEIRFHWDRLFGHWFKPGSKSEQWFNPSKSWTNKYLGKNRVIDFLFSTALVWTTDFWHLLKAITINSVFGIVLITANLEWDVWSYLVTLVGLNIMWGIFFETTMGIYGAASDKYMK